MNVWGKAADIKNTSFAMSTLDDALARVAGGQGRIAIPNPRPEKGSIYRADNFEFAKAGLPSLYIGDKEHLVARAPDAPLRADEFDLHDFPHVSDEVNLARALSGAA